MVGLYPVAMIPTRDPWEARLDWVLSAVYWAALTLSVVLSALSKGPVATVGVSALMVAGYVVAMQVLPPRIRNSEQWGELLAVIGVTVSLVAIALTGGAESPYVIFLAAPPLFAATFLGARIGFEIAALSAAGLFIVAAALGQPLLDRSTVQPAFLYALIALTFSQVRRLLIEERQRTVELQATAARIKRLETAHTLLASLSELANTQELNPVTIGNVALRDLAGSVPFESGRVTLYREDGEPVVVASVGDSPDGVSPREYPIDMRGHHLGRIDLWPQEAEDLELSHQVIESVVRPVGLAFDNIQLVQRIAHRAVHEERVRLARELHDNIGPSLASLGLRIDMLIYTMTEDPELIRHLEGTRGAITALVDEVRTTVADLRHSSVASIIEQAHEIAAEHGAAGPEISIAIDEIRPPRPGIAVELRAILTEAVRNAVEHSNTDVIEIEGMVDRDRGRLSIIDQGCGFDPNDLPPGHYGVVGMKERATAFGGNLTLASTPELGTRVTITWEMEV